MRWRPNRSHRSSRFGSRRAQSINWETNTTVRPNRTTGPSDQDHDLLRRAFTDNYGYSEGLAGAHGHTHRRAPGKDVRRDSGQRVGAGTNLEVVPPLGVGLRGSDDLPVRVRRLNSRRDWGWWAWMVGAFDGTGGCSRDAPDQLRRRCRRWVQGGEP